VPSFSLHNKLHIVKNLLPIIKVWLKIKNNPSFWENIPLKKDALLIYEKSNKISSDIHILTALPSFFYKKNSISFKLASEAKKISVQKNLPNIKPENIHICYSTEKHLVIKNNPSRFILVDDSATNIKNWEKAGGTGILVEPNSQKHLFTLNYLIK